MRQQLFQLSTVVRANEVEAFDDKLLTNLCLRVSRELVKALSDAGVPAKVIQGKYEVDEPAALAEETPGWENNELLHYWVESDGLFIDLTATQFANQCHEKLEEVTIGTPDELQRYKKLRIWI